MTDKVIRPCGGHAGASSACSGAARPSSSAAVPAGDDGRVRDSGLWRTALHEGGHLLCDRYMDIEIAGATLVEGPSYSGLVWGPQSVRALRGKAAYDDASAEAPEILAAQIAQKISRDLPGPGEQRDCSIFSAVQCQIIGLMGGGAAEMVMFEDRPLQTIASDVASAHALAGIVCRNAASQTLFVEHCYQEAVAIIEENKPVLLALAQALIDHPKSTLNAAEIDQVISVTLAAKTSDDERQRRLDWKRTEQSAALLNVYLAVPEQVS
jgi:hypothetical protein